MKFSHIIIFIFSFFIYGMAPPNYSSLEMPTKWKKLKLNLCIDQSILSIQNIKEDIKYSIGEWNEIDYSPWFVIAENKCDVYIKHEYLEQKDFEPVAITNNIFYSSGEIIKSTIIINQKYSFCDKNQIDVECFDIKTILLHELGHSLGLYEDLEYEDSVMWYKASFSEIKRKLSSEDFKSIKSLYKQ